MTQPERLSQLNDNPVARGARYVLYWMQASQRSIHNPALEHAVAQANELGLPVVVCFGLMDDYPEANERHYAFMLQGLADVRANLERRGILFVVRHGNPPEVAIRLAREAALVVCDRGYLRHQKQWRDQVADHARCRMEQVEGDVVVPVEEASEKAEFAARTIRPKIHRLWERFFVPLKTIRPRHSSLDLDIRGDIDVSHPAAALSRLKLDRSVKPVARFTGGQNEAEKRLRTFIAKRLGNYIEGRREPGDDGTSELSPYLHFGQISPVQIALAVRESDAPEENKEAYLEELIVRRELAMNFVNFTPDYDSYEALPRWAKQTLETHLRDGRPTTYSRSELEQARTADPFWNAAQTEMTATGFMHNALRMYWGKKILEWKKTPREAFEEALYLNNRYFLCGRDPVSYGNVAWVFGLHDRPWQERKIFGTVRYMNDSGLKRKFDMEQYIQKVEGLVELEKG